MFARPTSFNAWKVAPMDPCHIASFLLFGLVVGLIARFLLPGSQPMGWIMTIVLGVVGSFVGGFITSLVLGHESLGVRAAGWIMSVVGAMIVLFIYAKVAKNP
jgi:uncharacterized membrane protein YeaQ/YmgE (transglycosylase-associated protein family)